jgi:DNA-directed RNA polymerase subunit alpha
MQQKWRSIIRPKHLEVDESSLTECYGKFSAEPLERGFGTTIGNALRRTILSSIQGAAISAVKIDGILHEFSTIPGVKEDVSEIVLNIKEISVKLLNEGPETLYINAKGPGVIKASDIEPNSNVEMLNPDQHIATLSADAKINMEMSATTGFGYRSAEKNNDENLPIGTIPVDAIFSPIKRVNYNVNNARVGGVVDYERLTLEVWTNGTIAPEDAIAYAAKIVQHQLTLFINFDEEIEELPVEVDEKPKTNENLYRSIDELELSVRSANCLRNANIRYIWQLVGNTEGEMLKTKNFGRKSLNEIKEILTEMGLALGYSLEGFTPPEITETEEDYDPVEIPEEEDDDEIIEEETE